MDNERAADAINAFRSAEDSLKQLVSNADELTSSADALRDTDQSVKALAEALGIAGKHWTEIAEGLGEVAAEVRAAGKLLQKAEPQELMEAIDENTTSVGELREQTSSAEGAIGILREDVAQLTTRIDAIAESSTSLREALVAKMDLSQTSITQLQTDVRRASKESAERDKTAQAAITKSLESSLTVAKRGLYAASAAAILALAAAILAAI